MDSGSVGGRLATYMLYNSLIIFQRFLAWFERTHYYICTDTVRNNPTTSTETAQDPARLYPPNESILLKFGGTRLHSAQGFFSSFLPGVVPALCRIGIVVPRARRPKFDTNCSRDFHVSPHLAGEKFGYWWGSWGGRHWGLEIQKNTISGAGQNFGEPC